MGAAVKSDMQVTHMPIVRVLQKSTKKKSNYTPTPQKGKAADLDD